MDQLVPIAAVLIAILVGAISPGPSFIIVVRTALASRADGLAAALGMGVGGLLFAGAAFLGLHIVLTTVPWAYLGIKLAGGAYLLYLACRLWSGAARAPETINASSNPGLGSRNAFWLGRATQLSNPKTAVVYASIFSALLPHDQASWLAPVILPTIFFVEAGWYALVALMFSSAGTRRGYLRSKLWVDRVAAGMMGALGIKLIAETK